MQPDSINRPVTDTFDNTWAICLFFASFLFLIYTLYRITNKFDIEHLHEHKDKPLASLDFIFLAFWTVVPPVWFLAEYTWIFHEEKDPLALNAFKYSQELASKAWGAVVVLISITLFAKYGKKIG